MTTETPIWEGDEQLREEAPKVAAPAKLNGATRSLEILLWSQMIDVQPTDRLIRRLIGEGSLAVMFGQPGCGKSFLSLDLALHLACGLDWFGLAVRRSGVVFVAAEGQRGIVKRVAAFRKRHGIDIDADVPFAAIPSPIDLRSPDGDAGALVRAVAQAAQSFDMPVGLTVIDTLSRTFGGGNENDSADMAAFVANIDAVRTRTGAASLIVHHSGKDDARGMRGHSILKAAADTVLEVSGQEGTRTVTLTKQKDGETGASYSFNLESEEVGIDDEGQALTSCVVVPTTQAAASGKPARRKPLPPEYQKALDYLNDLIVDQGATVTANGVPSGARVVNVDLWREDLKRRGLHDGTGAGKKWFQRVRGKLIAENRILSQGDFVWTIRDSSGGTGT